jgi:hypothetical protein
MSTTYGKVFGGVIAVILLLLYALTMSFIVSQVVACGQQANCTGPIPITSGIIFVFTTVSGLVSALVVATLAITRPGANPSVRWLDDDSSAGKIKFISTLVIVYLVVWLLVGLTALVVGVMIYPNANQTLSDAGTTWIGLAVAAGYAYFGIKPRQ